MSVAVQTEDFDISREVAALTGLFGCATGGALAVLGMVGGFAIFTAPALLRFQLQRS